MAKDKIFISWSGETTNKIAAQVKEFIDDLFQSVETFLSSEGIAKGTDGVDHIIEELEDTYMGIICVTSESKDNLWVHYEAGSLAKGKGKKNRIFTILFDMKHTDISGPLARFQHTLFTENTVETKKDWHNLIKDINNNLQEDNRVDVNRLDRAFGRIWEDNQQRLTRLVEELNTSSPKTNKKGRDEKDLIEEVLEIVRDLKRGQESNYSISSESIEKARLDFENNTLVRAGKGRDGSNNALMGDYKRKKISLRKAVDVLNHYHHLESTGELDSGDTLELLGDINEISLIELKLQDLDMYNKIKSLRHYLKVMRKNC